MFWASWCPPCIQEAPAIERFANSLERPRQDRGRRLERRARGRDESSSTATGGLPNVRDAEGLVGSSYGLPSLPTTFVLDAHGRIHAMLRGPQSVASLEGALAGV